MGWYVVLGGKRRKLREPLALKSIGMTARIKSDIYAGGAGLNPLANKWFNAIFHFLCIVNEPLIGPFRQFP